MSWNAITEVVANAFEGLSSLTTLDLSGNAITEVAATAFAGLSSLASLDLSRNAITELVATTFTGLSSLTSFAYFKFETKEGRQAATAFCSNATDQTPPLAVAGTVFCAGYSTLSSEEGTFLVISASVSAFAGLLVLLQIRCKKGSITRWDLLHVAFFGFRVFDLFTDFGVYGFTAQKPDWDGVMRQAKGTTVKYMSLISAIIGAVLFVPDIFVYARKLGLNKDGEGGGFFNLYNPSQKAAIVIMCATLLLESIPQLVSALMIIHRYSWQTDTSVVTLPIVSFVLSCTTLLTDSFFLFKLCCGKCFDTCCGKCCHCDISGLFKANEEQPPPGLPLQARRQVPQPVAALNLNAVAVVQSRPNTLPNPKSFGVNETALGMPASSKGNVGNRAPPAYHNVPEQGYSRMARGKSLVLSNASAMAGTSLTDGKY